MAGRTIAELVVNLPSQLEQVRGPLETHTEAGSPCHFWFETELPLPLAEGLASPHSHESTHSAPRRRFCHLVAAHPRRPCSRRRRSISRSDPRRCGKTSRRIEANLALLRRRRAELRLHERRQQIARRA